MSFLFRRKPASAKAPTNASLPFLLPKEALDRPFYYRKPPLWIRASWVLLAADLLVTVTMNEFTWNKWTMKDEPTSQSDRKPSPAAETTSPASDDAKWVLRPAWQRAGLCLGHIIVGTAIASIIWTGRTRIVQRLHPITSPAGQREIFVQSGAHTRNKGFVVPISRTALSPGRDATEAILKVDGLRGSFLVECKGALMSGEKQPGTRILDSIVDYWGIKRSTPKISKDSKWTSGPIVGKSW